MSFKSEVKDRSSDRWWERRWWLGWGDMLRSSSIRQRSSAHAPCVLPSATEPSRRLLHLFGTVCRHYQFSAEDWRLNFLSGLTAVLSRERLTVLTTMWPHITVTCPCSPRTLCHVKSIRYHHHHMRGMRWTRKTVNRMRLTEWRWELILQLRWCICERAVGDL